MARFLLRSRCEGTTAIEFAIVAPALFLLIIGALEVSLMMFTGNILEGATAIGSRIGKTGYTSGGLPREEYIRTRINELSGGFLDPNLLQIDILSYHNFSNIGQPEPCLTPTCGKGAANVDFTDINGNGAWDQDQGQVSAGGAGAIVLYRVRYPWTLFTPLLRQFMGDENGVFNISAVATVRNEPF